MTRVSGPGGPSPRRPRVLRLLRSWHIPCFVLLAGCPYWVPLEFAPANEPPVFESVNPANDLPVSVTGSTHFFVVVRDGERDEVSFLWFVGGELLGTAAPVTTGQEDHGVYGSELTLPYDPRYDGQELTCEVFDGQSEPVRVRWTLEVL